MNKREILKGNILLAEFDGYKHSGKKGNLANTYYHEKRQPLHSKDFEYHKDWNVLMRVLEKIEETADTKIEIHHTVVLNWNYSTRKTNFDWKEERKPFDSIGGKFFMVEVPYSKKLEYKPKYRADSRILSVWLACVVWIEWYKKTVLKSSKKGEKPLFFNGFTHSN